MPESPRWWNAAVVISVAILAVGILVAIALGFGLMELFHIIYSGGPDN